MLDPVSDYALGLAANHGYQAPTRQLISFNPLCYE